jgi:hypothetical protein
MQAEDSMNKLYQCVLPHLGHAQGCSLGVDRGFRLDAAQHNSTLQMNLHHLMDLFFLMEAVLRKKT